MQLLSASIISWARTANGHMALAPKFLEQGCLDFTVSSSGPSTPPSRGLPYATVPINCPPAQAGQAHLFKSPSLCSASMWQRCSILVPGTFRHCVLPLVLCRSRAYPLRLTCPILLRCGKDLPVLPAQPTPGWQGQDSASQKHTGPCLYTDAAVSTITWLSLLSSQGPANLRILVVFAIRRMLQYHPQL